MKDGLKEINELVGVWGSLVCNNQGTIIQSNMPPGLTKSGLENINRHVLDIFNLAESPVVGMEEAVFHYGQKKLFVLDMKAALMIVITTPSIDLSLLRMTVNVVVNQWESNPKIQKIIQDQFVDRY